MYKHFNVGYLNIYKHFNVGYLNIYKHSNGGYLNISTHIDGIYLTNINFIESSFYILYLSNSIFQTLNSVRSNNLSLLYQRFTPTGSKDIVIRNFAFVTNT